MTKLTRLALGPYQLVAELDQGVHLAKLEGTKKLVIVKELRADSAGSSELRLATRLIHPNVARSYGVHEDQGKRYSATEYVDGLPWSRIRRALEQRDALSEALHLQVLIEVLSGLHYAHELRDHGREPLQIVHGGVSPRHVIATYEGLVKLVDFGAARAGKQTYSAPEQVRGDAVDRRADIFAVGVMLWEAMARRPFVQSQDEAELRRLRSSGLEPRVRAIVPDAPPVLADICDRALAHTPEERFATAAELRDALLGYLGHELRDSDRTQLGKLVQDAFQDERAKFHAVIDPQLRPAPAPTNLRAQLASARKLTSAPLTRTQPVSPAESAPLSPRVYAAWHRQLRKAVSLRGLRSGRVPLLVIGVALLSFGITWLVSRPEPQAVAPAAPPARGELPDRVDPRSNAVHSEEVAPSTEPHIDQPSRPETTTSLHAAIDPDRAAAPPSLMHLTITARPASAMLQLDGVPISDNPVSVSVAADQHQLHTIRASGAGLAPEERVVRFDRDQSISIDLEPRIARTGSPAAQRARKTQRPSAAPPEGPPNPAEANGGARQRARASDMFDAPLVVGRSPRPIYEDDPYPRTP